MHESASVGDASCRAVQIHTHILCVHAQMLTGLYEWVRKRWAAHTGRTPQALDTIAVACIADSIAGFLTNPFDVIKVREA